MSQFTCDRIVRDLLQKRGVSLTEDQTRALVIGMDFAFDANEWGTERVSDALFGAITALEAVQRGADCLLTAIEGERPKARQSGRRV